MAYLTCIKRSSLLYIYHQKGLDSKILKILFFILYISNASRLNDFKCNLSDYCMACSQVMTWLYRVSVLLPGIGLSQYMLVQYMLSLNPDVNCIVFT